MQQTLALVHYYARRYDDAMVAGRRALELNPQLALARSVTAKALLLKGDPRAAIAILEASPVRSTEGVMLLGIAQLRAGNRAAADALWKDLASRTPPPTGFMAQWHAATGNINEAIVLLNRGSSPAPLLRVDPLFDALRVDARFADIVKRTNESR
jgi:predicted Zn-dependent protease